VSPAKGFLHAAPALGRGGRSIAARAEVELAVEVVRRSFTGFSELRAHGLEPALEHECRGKTRPLNEILEDLLAVFVQLNWLGSHGGVLHASL
jgi:hypothetical protein